MTDEKKPPKPESLEAKFHLLARLPYDKRAKRKHILVFGFILDWYHSKYGDALASVRHVVASLRERDPFEAGLYTGDVHSALTDLVAWGYLEQTKGSGRAASRYTPSWNLVCVHKTPNTTADDHSVRENPNICVLETPNANEICIQKTPNEDPLTGPGHKTGEHVVGSMFEAAPEAPLPPPADAADGPGPASGRFEEYWKCWPRKHGIKKARAEWKKLDTAQQASAIAAAYVWAGHYDKHSIDKKWIPEPANWLAGERWDEDLPIVHIDGKGASIALAKANSTPKKDKKPSAANDNDDYLNEDDDGPYQMVCDVGPFDPCGKWRGQIVEGEVINDDRETQRVVLTIECESPGANYPVSLRHTFYFRHPDQAVEERGQRFISRFKNVLDLDEITDTDHLLYKPMQVSVDKRLAISYSRAA